MKYLKQLCLLVAITGGLISSQFISAQVPYERILGAADEPHNWLTYSGNYASTRHSPLRQIEPANVDDLQLKWVFQARSLEKFETSPLVVDGIMYLTEAPNTVLALDAKSGRAFWRYEYTPSAESRPCCGAMQRDCTAGDPSVPSCCWVRRASEKRRLRRPSLTCCSGPQSP